MVTEETTLTQMGLVLLTLVVAVDLVEVHLLQGHPEVMVAVVAEGVIPLLILLYLVLPVLLIVVVVEVDGTVTGHRVLQQKGQVVVEL